MSELDLNIDNYTLNDLYNLFNIPLGNSLDEQLLKNAKQIVLKIHPDKSQLEPKYFIFFSGAYKRLYSIYEFQNKKQFFNNCYNWLKPNGYLIIHLIDRDKFSARKFKDTLMDLPGLYRSMQPVKNERTLNTSAEFIDFLYEATYEIKPQTDIVVFKETFTDKQTKHVRQNENTLIMDSIEDILAIASKNGFIIQGKSDNCNGDENQYLYIFERTM